MQSLSEMSSTVVFLFDYASRNYPILGKSVQQVMGHQKEAFEEGGLDFMLHHHRDFEILNKEIFPDQLKIVEQQGYCQLSDLRFSRSYRFEREDGKYNTVLQRHTVVSSRNETLPVAIFGFA